MALRKTFSKFSTIIGLSAIILLAGWRSSAANNDGQHFLTPLPQSRNVHTDTKDPLSIQQRLVTFNPMMLMTRSASPLLLDLFDGEQINIEVSHSDQSPSGGFSITGRATGYPLSDIAFTWQGDVAAGTINLGHEIYRLRHIENGVHAFEQLPAQYLLSGEPITPADLEMEPHASRSTHAPEIEIEDVSQPDQAVSIDVLVLYTQSAETAMGGIVGTQNTIDLAITESNTGFQQSGINVKFDLVHSHKVDFGESKKNFSTILDNLTQTNDGELDEIHALRDYYGADVVTMIVNRPLLCGKTYQNNGDNGDFSRYAFSVLHHSCVTGYYSFAHEIGHNMGSQHNRANSSQPGAFNYSYGFQDPANRFRTIMAYNCASTCLRVNHWSNPNVSYQGFGPTGHNHNSANGADNHRSLSQMAPSVAAFRNRTLVANQPVEVAFQTAETGRSIANSNFGFIDSGKPLQAHADQFVFGWNADYTDSIVGENSTYIYAIANEGEKATWQMLVPNGKYQVKLTSGDLQAQLQPAGFLIEDEVVINNQSSNATTLFEADIAVEVVDGYLTISGTTHETVLNSLEITPLSISDQNITPLPEGVYTAFLPIVVR